jgi:hypothetical protein
MEPSTEALVASFFRAKAAVASRRPARAIQESALHVVRCFFHPVAASWTECHYFRRTALGSAE